MTTDSKVDHVPYDYVIKWKHFPRYWPFQRGIHRSPVNSPHKGRWRRALMFSLICAWLNRWVYNREAGDLRRNRAHYDVIVKRYQNVPPRLLYIWKVATVASLCSADNHSRIFYIKWEVQSRNVDKTPNSPQITHLSYLTADLRDINCAYVEEKQSRYNAGSFKIFMIKTEKWLRQSHVVLVKHDHSQLSQTNPKKSHLLAKTSILSDVASYRPKAAQTNKITSYAMHIIYNGTENIVATSEYICPATVSESITVTS